MKINKRYNAIIYTQWSIKYDVYEYKICDIMSLFRPSRTQNMLSLRLILACKARNLTYKIMKYAI